jgi:hypothetical protein
MKEEIHFAIDNIFSVIADILTKNGLSADLNDDVDSQKNNSPIDVVFKLSKNLASRKSSEKDFISELQKNLGIQQPAAQNILNDIKSKILPSAEKVSIGQPEPKSAKPAKLITENKKTIRSSAKPEPIQDKETAAPKIIEQKIQQKRGPDSYREPLN